MDGCKQLSLEKLYLNRSLSPQFACANKQRGQAEQKEQIKLKRQQAKNILAALKRGDMTTSQLSGYARQYNTRIKELREFLQNSGKTIDCIPVSGGNNIYKIVPLHGSRYQAELMARQKRRYPASPKTGYAAICNL